MACGVYCLGFSVLGLGLLIAAVDAMLPSPLFSFAAYYAAAAVSSFAALAVAVAAVCLVLPQDWGRKAANSRYRGELFSFQRTSTPFSKIKIVGKK